MQRHKNNMKTELNLKNDYIKLTPEKRLYNIENPIVAITGNIGGGKSTVSSFFKSEGLLVLDADQLIHRIYEDEKTIEFVKNLCPVAVINDEVDFSILRKVFFANGLIKSQLEKFLYQQLPKYFKEAIENSEVPVIYDVPLLFEKKLEDKVDYVIVISSDEESQLKRILKRDPNSDEATVKAIIAKQLPNKEKIKNADLVIENHMGLKELEEQCQKAKVLLFEKS